MLKKIFGGFHFRVALLGTEILALTLFTDDDMEVVEGYWEGDDDEGDEGDDDDEDGDDDPDPTDAMLDTLNEIVRWEGGQ